MSDNIVLEFSKPFSIDKYELFLKAKKLPEHSLKYDWRKDAYFITTHKRFAKSLGITQAEYTPSDLPISDFLFDYQEFIIKQAIAAKRYAIYADCGLGKTLMFLEFARHVIHKTGGKVLIFSPLQIIQQTMEEAVKFYNKTILHLKTRKALREWLQADNSLGELAITNYEKMAEGELPELNYLDGLIADESSIFKTGGGVIKWNILHSINGKSGMAPTGIEYRLSCTATPAPNDIMEYASQASFLGKLRNEGDILWTYFSRDKYGNWGIKPYAEEGFYRFLSSWSIYIRDPKHYGFYDNLKNVPDPEFHIIKIPETQEQKDLELKIRRQGNETLFGDLKLGVVKRSRLSQVAKGFMYEKDKSITYVNSEKPKTIIDIINTKVREGQILVWTVFDEEGEILLRGLPDYIAKNLTGKTNENERLEIIENFRHGELPVLISKPELLGFGLNFQFCNVMIFSGFNDSFEQFYQAIKRAHRFGQTKALQVYIPYIPELEEMIYENIVKKKNNFEKEVARHDEIYKKIIIENGSLTI